MKAVEDFFSFQKQDIAPFSQELDHQGQFPDDSRIQLFLQPDADDPLVGVLAHPGNSRPGDVFSQIRAEARRHLRVGVFLGGQMEAEKLRVGGDDQVLLLPLPAKADQEIGAVHLVDLGYETAADFLLQFADNPADDKEVHG